LALLIGSLTNYFINPDPLNLDVEVTYEEVRLLRKLREFIIPITHFILMIMCFVINSERI
jgi:hypothetical protein